MNLESPTKSPFPVHDADELLKDTEDLLQYGTWIWTQDTGTMEWSHGMYRLLGYADHDTGGIFLDDFLRHLPGGDGDKFLAFLNGTLEHNVPFQLIHTVCTLRGAYVRVLTKGRIAVKDEK